MQTHENIRNFICLFVFFVLVSISVFKRKSNIFVDVYVLEYAF